MSEVRNPLTIKPAEARGLADQHAYIRDNVQIKPIQKKKPGTGPRNRFEKGFLLQKKWRML